MHVLPKVFEVRDRGTFIPVLAVKLGYSHETERYLLARSGYGKTHEDVHPFVLVTRLAGGGPCHHDPHAWSDVTMRTAHAHIQKEWASLASGQVIDCEHVRGETPFPKESESRETPI